MKAPDFWWRPRATLVAATLAPVGAIYGALTAARMDRRGAAAGVPVICVGNLVAGGAGKTPTAIALARMLLAAGRRPAFLSRGYGRRDTGQPSDVLAVDLRSHAARDCGDEPLLLAAVAPTFVATDRRAAARRAIDAGADLLILDDGLQNPSLAKDLSLAVVDGETGIGNGLCLPAGPLRAPIGRQWPHVSMLCVIGPGEAGRRLSVVAEGAGVPVTKAQIRPDPAVLAALKGRRLAAFAGIGRPAKFFAMLAAEGLETISTRAFPDHHRFGAGELDDLARRAERTGAHLVTTAKDQARLPPGFPATAVPIELVFDDPAAMAARLAALRPLISP